MEKNSSVSVGGYLQILAQVGIFTVLVLVAIQLVSIRRHLVGMRNELGNIRTEQVKNSFYGAPQATRDHILQSENPEQRKRFMESSVFVVSSR